MNIGTRVFEQIVEDTKETARLVAINQMVLLMRQTSRFSHLDPAAMEDLAARAWRGEVDLDKEMT